MPAPVAAEAQKFPPLILSPAYTYSLRMNSPNSADWVAPKYAVAKTTKRKVNIRLVIHNEAIFSYIRNHVIIGGASKKFKTFSSDFNLQD